MATLSKVAQVKLQVGYQEKTTPRQCGTCEHFKSTFEYPSWVMQDYQKVNFDNQGYAKNEKNMKCGLMDFTVKKMGLCDHYEPKPAPPVSP